MNIRILEIYKSENGTFTQRMRIQYPHSDSSDEKFSWCETQLIQA